ncbi:MAG TPA: hypothetical protein IAB89_10155 [Candidatus Caccousia avicola]|uniref:Uncharacterized protein n=1 Tax=Candidatus Caccousia avicola TaxID=2840721 RepID=A0A9D1AP00_9FIRM|nr:hypothetical protein [Candidatus Caccousia avicola]
MTIKPKRKRGTLRRTALLMTALVLLLQLTGCASIIHRLAFPRSAIVPETVEVEGETYYRLRLTLLSVVENRKLSKRVECAK